MKKKYIALILCITNCVASTGHTQEYKSITARYRLASKVIFDPPPREKKDRVLLFLEGDGAKEIYESMPSPAHEDQCNSDLMTKTTNGLECFKNINGTYYCTVGIILKSGSTTKASIC